MQFQVSYFTVNPDRFTDYSLRLWFFRIRKSTISRSNRRPLPFRLAIFRSAIRNMYTRVVLICRRKKKKIDIFNPPLFPLLENSLKNYSILVKFVHFSRHLPIPVSGELTNGQRRVIPLFFF